MTAAPELLRVGFLHVGRERSGVRRYGAIVAQAAGRRADVDAVESDVGDRRAGWSDLRRAARGLRGCDIVQLQWKLADWDARVGGIPRMEVVLRTLPRPVVVTLHDVLPRAGRFDRWLSLGALGLRRLGMAASRVIVHSEEERRRLDGLVTSGRIVVIPHFVEDRPPRPDRAAARAALDVDGRRVITLLGAMTKRRGHRLVLEALTRLPDDVIALFVGAPIEGRDHIEAGLRSAAAELGVEDRVRFLGYVDDDALEVALAASDVGLCPFREMSASGALATWLSSGRPIVAMDLPAMRELDDLVPGALTRFEPYDATPLAAATLRALERATAAPDALIESLAARLSTAHVAERYVAVYREAVDEAGATVRDVP